MDTELRKLIKDYRAALADLSSKLDTLERYASNTEVIRYIHEARVHLKGCLITLDRVETFYQVNKL